MYARDDETVSIRNEVLRVISELLFSNGFEVTTDYRVDGLSGYSHYFHIFAQRGETKLLIDVPKDVFEVLASLAKRVDVRTFDFLIVAERNVMRGILPDVETPVGEVLRGATFIVFDSLQDLRVRLQQFLEAKLTRAR